MADSKFRLALGLSPGILYHSFAHFSLLTAASKNDVRAGEKFAVAPPPVIPEIMARATLDKSGNVAATRERPVGGTSAGYIFLRTTCTRACFVRVPGRVYVARRRSWMVGRGRRGWSWPRERTHTTEERNGERSEDWSAWPRTSPIRVLFVPPAIFPSTTYTFPCEATLRFPRSGENGWRVDASWKKGAG